jgi:hypothetical protein
MHSYNFVHCVCVLNLTTTREHDRVQFRFLEFNPSDIPGDIRWKYAEHEYGRHVLESNGTLSNVLKAFASCAIRHTKSQLFNGAPIVNLPALQQVDVLLDFTPAQVTAGTGFYLYFSLLWNLFVPASDQFSWFEHLGFASRGCICVWQQKPLHVHFMDPGGF